MAMPSSGPGSVRRGSTDARAARRGLLPAPPGLALLPWLFAAGCCGDEYVHQRIYGGGTVEVTLEAASPGAGLAGSGLAPGWDPALAGDIADPGGAYFEGGRLASPSYGIGCVELSRTDVTACTITGVCVYWRDRDSIWPELIRVWGEVDIAAAPRGNPSSAASEFSAPTVATGALTVEGVTWEDPDCGTSTLRLQWAFDEENPYEELGYGTCL